MVDYIGGGGSKKNNDYVILEQPLKYIAKLKYLKYFRYVFDPPNIAQNLVKYLCRCRLNDFLSTIYMIFGHLAYNLQPI